MPKPLPRHCKLTLLTLACLYFNDALKLWMTPSFIWFYVTLICQTSHNVHQLHVVDPTGPHIHSLVPNYASTPINKSCTHLQLLCTHAFATVSLHPLLTCVNAHWSHAPIASSRRLLSTFVFYLFPKVPHSCLWQAHVTHQYFKKASLESFQNGRDFGIMV